MTHQFIVDIKQILTKVDFNYQLQFQLSYQIV
jgi:hypothetical protein